MKDKREVQTQKSPQAIGPYSQAVRYGDLIFVSGQLPLTVEGKIISDDVEEQTHQVMKNISGILEEENSGMKDIIKTTIFVDDIKDFSKINEIYQNYLSEPYPARSCIEAAEIPKEAKIKIEVIAKSNENA